LRKNQTNYTHLCDINPLIPISVDKALALYLAGSIKCLTNYHYLKTAQPILDKLSRRLYNWLGHMLRRSDVGKKGQTSTAVDIARPQRKMTKEYL